ncbi:MAG: Ribonuclease 3 [Parcubacteria group bacterium GW2011_GWA2_46_7]|nr:MAG: Ribonuclease 3 [Parcubacteria group bacterium GW2011_GWA2_46_7]
MDLSLLEVNLGYTFANKKLLFEAITHRSYLNENRSWQFPHNERLEFLGDAVLELVVTEYLFSRFGLEEGILTSYRAALVNAQSLAEVSQDIGVNDFLLLSRGEARDSNSKGRLEILGNAFEALVGALYLDGGYGAAKDFLNRILTHRIEGIIEKGLYKDPKSRFQEEAQARVGETPVYKSLDEWGPDHEKQFLIGVYLGGEEIAQGVGRSKQDAEVNAAQNAIEKRGWNNH